MRSGQHRLLPPHVETITRTPCYRFCQDAGEPLVLCLVMVSKGSFLNSLLTKGACCRLEAVFLRQMLLQVSILTVTLWTD